MYILDYNENSTAKYMYKQTVIHTTLSNRPIIIVVQCHVVKCTVLDTACLIIYCV